VGTLSEQMAVRREDGDPLEGRRVTIRSLGGIEYTGIVVSVRREKEGELFELGEDESRSYRRLVHVTDRDAQVRLLD
jgi:hypothetical protein